MKYYVAMETREPSFEDSKLWEHPEDEIFSLVLRVAEKKAQQDLVSDKDVWFTVVWDEHENRVWQGRVEVSINFRVVWEYRK